MLVSNADVSRIEIESMLATNFNRSKVITVFHFSLHYFSLHLPLAKWGTKLYLHWLLTCHLKGGVELIANTWLMTGSNGVYGFRI